MFRCGTTQDKQEPDPSEERNEQNDEPNKDDDKNEIQEEQKKYQAVQL
ncbi:hypothetical protein [Fictibacillus terranigra]|uniref:Uncharacterized protein n=1 Tax=Fictibacillus terranigra TaxID=3058424 RepID=A0ABT8E4Q2_9BACL|nr:hypothetical protein [Fictibacillus sp. CENA-BCM004]MDN4072892.1 hypothetical protein [Fictibacillus sp. CENA-BCM004]